MLKPLICDETRGWHVPAEALRACAETHFAMRAAERGMVDVPPALLKWVVDEALRLGRDDLVQHVFDLGERATLCRILLESGPWYPVICPAQRTAMTLYSADMARRVRRKLKWQRRNPGRPFSVVRGK